MNRIKGLSLLLVFLCIPWVSIIAQNVNVSGIVMDNHGLSMPGVSISIEGTKTGTITDMDGRYNLSVQKGATLLFSFVGYTTTKVSVEKSDNMLNITLHESNVDLDEVVVVGYGTQTKRTITSSVTKVSGETMENVPVNSIGDALKGKVAGVRLYSENNTPGSDATFTVRGGSSINGSNDPLILVDGVERGISGLDANDIESIEVLKDAAASALYGSRASNGVILITTKRGKSGAPKITFQATFALQQPERRYDLMDAEDWLTYMRQAVAISEHPEYNYTNGYAVSSANTSSSIYSTRYLEDGESVPDGYKSMTDPLDSSKTLIFQDNDWQSELFRNALWQNYYVGITGGNETVKYNASAGYTDDGGVGLATDYSRFNSRINLDVKVNEKLSFAAGFDYSQTTSSEYDSQYQVISRGLSMPPTQKIYNDDGTPTKGYNSTAPNPVWWAYYNDVDTDEKYLSVFGKLTYNIIDNLKADVQLSQYNAHGSTETFEEANEYSSLRTTTAEFEEVTRNKLEAYLSYNKTLGDHSFSILGGYSYENEKEKDLYAEASGASTDKVQTLSAGPTKADADSDKTEEVTIGYFGRLTYDFKHKYLFSATFREDASSKFADGNRWGFFPGASVGWVMSEENFMKNVTAIDNLKWRLSYGLTGNNDIGIYDAYGEYATDVKYYGNAGIVTSTMPNSALTWEKTAQFDIGFDLSLFNSRLGITADYFDKRTKNLLFDEDLPDTSGFSSVTVNTGKVKFYGFDVEINSTNIQTKDFTWTSSFTWSFVKNKVLELPDNGRDKNRIGGTTLADGTAYGGIAEGESLYGFYGYVVAYIIETEEQADNAMYDTKSYGYRSSDGQRVAGRKEVGDYEWVNREGSETQDGEEIISTQDQFLLGYTVPHSTGGLGNYFTYKNFSLGVYLDWALGHSIYNQTYQRYFSGTFNSQHALAELVKQCWTEPGDDTIYAKFKYNDLSYNYMRTSNIFTTKGNYLCVREISLSYNLPKKIVSKWGIEGLAFTVAGNNLHYFTAVEGVSPEVGTSTTYSSSYNNYPAIRKFSIGVKLTI